MTEVDPWLGKTLNNSIHVYQRLGEGGMAFIYLGRHLASDKRVVVKIPRAEMLHDASFVARFKREIDALIKLAHPCIVKILAHGQADRTPYAVLRYLEGGSLNGRHPRDAAGKTSPVDPRRLGDWLPGVASALDFIHANNYLHRDVKPDNILFDDEGKSYLTDFGIAKVAADARPVKEQTVHTKLGMVVGTLQTMAPEVILGRPSDGRLDQYALAVTVFQQLTGRFPFDDPTSTKILVQHVSESPSGLEAHVPHLSRELTTVVHKGLAKDPAQRYPSCTAFADATLEAVWNLSRPRMPNSEAATEPPRLASRPFPAGATARPSKVYVEMEMVPAAPIPEPATGSAVATESITPFAPSEDRSANLPLRRRLDDQGFHGLPTRSPNRRSRNGVPVGLLVGFGAILLLVAIGTVLWATRVPPPSKPVPRLIRSADVRLVAGGKATATVWIERNGRAGNLNVSVTGLPSGVLASPGVYSPGRDSVELTFISTPRADTGPFQATLSLWDKGERLDQQGIAGKVMAAEPPPAAPPPDSSPSVPDVTPPAQGMAPAPLSPIAKSAPTPAPVRNSRQWVFRDRFENTQGWGVETLPDMGIVSRRLPGRLSFTCRKGGGRRYQLPCPQFTEGVVVMKGTLGVGSKGGWGITIANLKNRNRGVQVTVDQAGFVRVGPWMYDRDPKQGPKVVGSLLGERAGLPNLLSVSVKGQQLTVRVNNKALQGVEPIRGPFTPGNILFQTIGSGPITVDLHSVTVLGPRTAAP